MTAQGERFAPAVRLVALYYLATPLFAMLDFRGGLDLRAAFLQGHPGARLLYYAVLFAIGILVSQRPVLAPALGLLESGVNVCLLAVSVMATYANAVVAAGEPGNFANPFTPAAVINLCLSAAVLAISYLSLRVRGPGGRYQLTGSR